VIIAAIEASGHKPGSEICLGIDAAASEFFQDGKYVLAREGRTLSPTEMISLYEKWIGEYPIIPSKTVCTKTTGLAGQNSRSVLDRKCSLWAMISSSQIRRGLAGHC